MKCINCEYEHEEAFEYCPVCGTSMGGGFADRVRAVVGSGAFLAICILITAATALSMLAGMFDVVDILLTIFLWLAYGAAKKGTGLGDGLRRVSGTVYAMYIIVNVASIIVMVCGVILAALSPMLTNLPLEEYEGEIMSMLEMPAELELPELAGAGVGFILVTFGIAFVLVGAVFLVFNLLSTKKIHKFAKSLYMSVNSGTAALEKVSAAKNWLMVFGVFGAISAVSSISGDIASAVASGCGAAAAIIASVLCREFAE